MGYCPEYKVGSTVIDEAKIDFYAKYKEGGVVLRWMHLRLSFEDIPISIRTELVQWLAETCKERFNL